MIYEIAKDLVSLSACRTAWTDSRALFEKLRFLCELPSVRMRAGADAGPLELLSEIKSELTKAMAFEQDEDRRTAMELLFFLNADAYDEHESPLTLESRYQQIGPLLHIAPSSVRNGERELLCARAAELLVHTTGQGDIDVGENAQAVIERSLQRFYSTEMPPSALASLVLSNHKPFFNGDLKLQLEPGSNSKCFKVTMSLEFAARLTEYFVVLAREESVLEALDRRARRIIDGHVIKTSEMFEEAARAFQKRTDVLMEMITEYEAAGETLYRGFTLNRVADSDCPSIIDPEIASPESYALFYASIPEFKRGKLSPYKTVHSYEVPISNGSSFWYTDRPTHLRSLQVDVSQLGGSVPTECFSVRSFMPGEDSEADRNRFGIFHRRVDAWLVRRHGVLIQWDLGAN